MDISIVTDFADHFAMAKPEKVALKFEGQDVTYSQFQASMNRVAHGLISLDLKQDERVGYLGKNSHHYFELLFGVARAGGVTCPVNWRLAIPEIAYILNDAKVRILFLGAEYADISQDLKDRVAGLEHIIIMEPSELDFPVFSQWYREFPSQPADIARTSEDAFVQLYTSGTTGHPKGAVISNGALLGLLYSENPDEIPDWNRWTENDVALIAMPCFHIGGTGFGLMALSNGATGVVMREFIATKILDFIDEFKISKIFLVPAAMQFVVNQPNARNIDYSQLKFMSYGASPIPLELLKQCMDVFGCGFVQMYGMTETAGTIVALPPEDHDPEGNPRMRSAGKALDGVELAIFDEDGNHLPVGEIGEIATRSNRNMSGYWNLAEATAKTITKDGWLRTGDAGYMDEDGYLYIHDRVKDMIISGGENIYPAEVENALYSHEGLADVAVIGVPDEKWGEAVKAIVVLKDGQQLSDADIITYAKTQIAAFKCPKSVEFIHELPRNASGKILRRKLREKYWVNKERSVN